MTEVLLYVDTDMWLKQNAMWQHQNTASIKDVNFNIYSEVGTFQVLQHSRNFGMVSHISLKKSNLILQT